MPDDPLGFLLGAGGAASLPEAAYRFARHEPGCHVVLTGTGSVDHLAENVASINGPPLPADHLAQLQTPLRPHRHRHRRLIGRPGLPEPSAQRSARESRMSGRAARAASTSASVERPADRQAQAAVGVDAHRLEHG